MTGTNGSHYDASVADLVARTLRAVAEATPADSTALDLDSASTVRPRADVNSLSRRRRRARWVAGLTAAAAAALIVAALWPQGDGRVETSRSSEPPLEPARRPLADEQVVARGEVDGRPWRLYAQPFEDGLMCMELTEGGGGCGGMPTDKSPLGAVYQVADSIEGSRFVHGTVVREAAEVTVELANGEELSVAASQPAFGVRFYVIPIPAGPDVVAVTAREGDGGELERVELAPGDALQERGGVDAFCAEMTRLSGERPERYVGSPEHIEDIEALRAVAPGELRSELDIYKDFLASGAVDPEDPDSNLTENWPPGVQAAIARIISFEEAHC